MKKSLDKKYGIKFKQHIDDTEIEINIVEDREMQSAIFNWKQKNPNLIYVGAYIIKEEVTINIIEEL